MNEASIDFAGIPSGIERTPPPGGRRGRSPVRTP